MFWWNIIAASEIPAPSEWNEIVKQGGPFAGGTIFGCTIAYFMFRLASGARSEREKLDLQREQELLKQNGIKDKRIDELHKRLEECIERERKGKA